MEVDAGVEVLPGGPDRVPLSDDLWVPSEASSSAPPASLGRRLFTLTLPHPSAEPGIFVLLLTSISSLIYKDSLINFIALFIVFPI